MPQIGGGQVGLIGVRRPQEGGRTLSNDLDATAPILSRRDEMKAEVFLPEDYKPAEDEPFMNDRQLEYFRRKLIDWKSEILEDSRDTIEGMKDSTRNIPDVADRASEETDRALELRTRDRQRKLVAKIDSALRRIEEGETPLVASVRGARQVTFAVIATSLTLIAVIALGTSTLAVRYGLEPAYTAGDDVADANERFQTIAQTSTQGMRDVRLFNMRPSLIERMQTVLDDYVRDSVRLQRNQAGLKNLNQFTNAVVVFGLVYVGFQYTPLSLGELGVFLFAVFRLSPVVNQVNTMTYQLDGQLPHFLRVQSRIRDLQEMEVPDADGGKPVSAVREVSFDALSFAYEDERVLEDVSFKVEKGEKIALVGPSGAGKSTIVSLLGRLQTPGGGEVLADGVSIGEFDVGQWRERLAIVRQDPFLFDDTLFENVTVGNQDASQRDVELACEVAQVTEFLPELSNGYDTELGEDGTRLSGGQKQRVAIARALLKDADILVLDEATSELDSNIERDVYEGIRKRESEYATISIAHDLSTIDDADRIYTLVDGSITEDGTHEQLLERNGTYANLYATQT